MEPKICSNKEMVLLGGLIISLENGRMRNILLSTMEREVEIAQDYMYEKALKENKITAKDLLTLTDDFGCKKASVAELCRTFYDDGIEMQSKEKDDRKFLATESTTPLFKAKDFIKEKYDVDIITIEELNNKIKKEFVESSVDDSYIG